MSREDDVFHIAVNHCPHVSGASLSAVIQGIMGDDTDNLTDLELANLALEQLGLPPVPTATEVLRELLATMEGFTHGVLDASTYPQRQRIEQVALQLNHTLREQTNDTVTHHGASLVFATAAVNAVLQIHIDAEKAEAVAASIIKRMKM